MPGLFQREMENHQDFQQLVQVGIGGVIFIVDILNLPYIQRTNWTVEEPEMLVLQEYFDLLDKTLTDNNIN